MSGATNELRITKRTYNAVEMADVTEEIQQFKFARYDDAAADDSIADLELICDGDDSDVDFDTEGTRTTTIQHSSVHRANEEQQLADESSDVDFDTEGTRTTETNEPWLNAWKGKMGLKNLDLTFITVPLCALPEVLHAYTDEKFIADMMKETNCQRAIARTLFHDLCKDFKDPRIFPALNFRGDIGRLTIDKLLGEGGSSFVYSVKGASHTNQVVKICKEDSDVELEVQLLQRLAENHIQGVIQCVAHTPTSLLLTPKATMCITELFKRNLNLSRSCLAQVVRTLEACHKQARVFHCDCRDTNLLLVNGSQIILADFGCGMRADAATTLHWGAPHIYRSYGLLKDKDIFRARDDLIIFARALFLLKYNINDDLLQSTNTKKITEFWANTICDNDEYEEWCDIFGFCHYEDYAGLAAAIARLDPEMEKISVC